MPTPEDLAAQYVHFPPGDPPGGHHAVVLSAPGADPVLVGPFLNPAVARERLDAVRRFVATVVRRARAGQHDGG